MTTDDLVMKVSFGKKERTGWEEMNWNVSKREAGLHLLDLTLLKITKQTFSVQRKREIGAGERSDLGRRSRDKKSRRDFVSG